MEPHKPVNMQELQELYDDIKEQKEFKFLVIVVKTPVANAPEIIINPRENFEGKVAYYMNAYANDGRLKNNPDVQILGVAFTQEGSSAFTFADGFI